MTAPASPTAQRATWSADTTIYVAWTPPAVMTGVVGYRIEYADNPMYLSNGSVVMDGGVNVGLVSASTLTGMIGSGGPGFGKAIRVGTRNAAGEYGWFGTGKGSVAFATTLSGDNDGWASYGTLPAGLSTPSWGSLRRAPVYVQGVTPVVGLLREVARSSSGSVTAGAVGIERTFTGLTIGATYKLNGTAVSLQGTTPSGNIYRWAVVGIGSGSNATTSNTTTPVAIPEYTFVATGTSHVVRIELNEAASWSGTGWFEAVGFYGLSLVEHPPASPYRLQDVGLEASLARHFAVANDSVGAVWWVDSDDVTRFRQVPEESAIVATFTDVRALGEHEYVDISASYDTRNVVNDLAATNMGRDAVTGDPVDVAYPVVDAASVTEWGVRSGSIETSLRAGYVLDTNYVPNPSAEVNVTNLGPTTASQTLTRSTAQFQSGVASAAAQRTGTTGACGVAITDGSVIGTSGTIAILTCVAGTTYTASAYARCSAARGAAMKIRWFNAANAVIGSDTAPADTTLSTSAWTRLSASAAAPAGAVKAVAYLQTASTMTTSDILYVDGFMWSVAGAAPSYFDGATADTGDLVYEWLGPEHNSASVIKSFAHLNERLATIVDELKTPEVVVESITWNAQENPELGALLDVQDRIRVRFRGVTRDYRVVGMTHKITGTRWLITMALAA